MLVLGTGIVQVFSGDDECSKEDSVSGTWHSFGYFGKSVSESFEVDERSKEGRNLDVGLFADVSDEGLQ